MISQSRGGGSTMRVFLFVPVAAAANFISRYLLQPQISSIKRADHRPSPVRQAKFVCLLSLPQLLCCYHASSTQQQLYPAGEIRAPKPRFHLNIFDAKSALLAQSKLTSSASSSSEVS